MKKIVLLITIAFLNFNCSNELELDKVEVENLIFDKRANEYIKFDKVLITEEYEDWRYWNFMEMEDDSNKFVQPFFKIRYGKDSIKYSFLPLRTYKELEKDYDVFEVESIVVSNQKFSILYSDYFPDKWEDLEFSRLSGIVEKRYIFSDSLNQNCPEWWIFGSEKKDSIEIKIFDEILNGYLKFTSSRYLKSSKDDSKEEFLKKQKEIFPFRVSIEEPMCRFGE